jgi:sulfur carrier protein
MVMTISVNGEQVSLDQPCTVRDLLERFRLGEAPCAVEINRALVPKRRHADHLLSDGDHIEIVTLVGGG